MKELKLKSEQIKMFTISEDDIKNGRLLSEDDLEFCPECLRQIKYYEKTTQKLYNFSRPPY